MTTIPLINIPMTNASGAYVIPAYIDDMVPEVRRAREALAKASDALEPLYDVEAAASHAFAELSFVDASSARVPLATVDQADFDAARVAWTRAGAASREAALAYDRAHAALLDAGVEAACDPAVAAAVAERRAKAEQAAQEAFASARAALDARNELDRAVGVAHSSAGVQPGGLWRQPAPHGGAVYVLDQVAELFAPANVR